ncbi:hypothetical protein HYG81_14880 [Natrinema zhouii]|uniref:Uncharacterized protein n=1 Tax=Natrinema zhouii TaxID=1710539 RepID=A0A7D6CMW4_9EURY|nr:hypothetical protein [Natrinema zhouii]QLK25357.1 hypothetical protein HYG81_14880 [Natrinema zhouii]
MSFVVAGGLTALLPSVTLYGYSVPAVAVVGYGTAVGVFIDLDHFLIARFKTGNWDAVRFCLSNPGAAVGDQSEIFEPGDVGVLSRLLSHVVIGGIVVPVLALLSVPLAIVTGVVLYAHLLADLVWDIALLEDHVETAGSTADLVRTLR